jgi:hypothetical protein
MMIVMGFTVFAFRARAYNKAETAAMSLARPLSDGLMTALSRPMAKKVHL